jgi:chromosome segregation ATPase
MIAQKNDRKHLKELMNSRQQLDEMQVSREHVAAEEEKTIESLIEQVNRVVSERNCLEERAAAELERLQKEYDAIIVGLKSDLSITNARLAQQENVIERLQNETDMLKENVEKKGDIVDAMDSAQSVRVAGVDAELSIREQQLLAELSETRTAKSELVQRLESAEKAVVSLTAKVVELQNNVHSESPLPVSLDIKVQENAVPECADVEPVAVSKGSEISPEGSEGLLNVMTPSTFSFGGAANDQPLAEGSQIDETEVASSLHVEVNSQCEDIDVTSNSWIEAGSQYGGADVDNARWFEVGSQWDETDVGVVERVETSCQCELLADSLSANEAGLQGDSSSVITCEQRQAVVDVIEHVEAGIQCCLTTDGSETVNDDGIKPAEDAAFRGADAADVNVDMALKSDPSRTSSEINAEHSLISDLKQWLTDLQQENSLLYSILAGHGKNVEMLKSEIRELRLAGREQMEISANRERELESLKNQLAKADGQPEFVHMTERLSTTEVSYERERLRIDEQKMLSESAGDDSSNACSTSRALMMSSRPLHVERGELFLKKCRQSTICLAIPDLQPNTENVVEVQQCQPKTVTVANENLTEEFGTVLEKATESEADYTGVITSQVATGAVEDVEAVGGKTLNDQTGQEGQDYYGQEQHLHMESRDEIPSLGTVVKDNSTEIFLSVTDVQAELVSVTTEQDGLKPELHATENDLQSLQNQASQIEMSLQGETGELEYELQVLEEEKQRLPGHVKHMTDRNEGSWKLEVEASAVSHTELYETSEFIDLSLVSHITTADSSSSECVTTASHSDSDIRDSEKKAAAETESSQILRTETSWNETQSIDIAQDVQQLMLKVEELEAMRVILLSEKEAVAEKYSGTVDELKTRLAETESKLCALQSEMALYSEQSDRTRMELTTELESYRRDNAKLEAECAESSFQLAESRRQADDLQSIVSELNAKCSVLYDGGETVCAGTATEEAVRNGQRPETDTSSQLVDVEKAENLPGDAVDAAGAIGDSENLQLLHSDIEKLEMIAPEANSLTGNVDPAKYVEPPVIPVDMEGRSSVPVSQLQAGEEHSELKLMDHQSRSLEEQTGMTDAEQKLFNAADNGSRLLFELQSNQIVGDGELRQIEPKVLPATEIGLLEEAVAELKKERDCLADKLQHVMRGREGGETMTGYEADDENQKQLMENLQVQLENLKKENSELQERNTALRKTVQETELKLKAAVKKREKIATELAAAVKKCSDAEESCGQSTNKIEMLQGEMMQLNEEREQLRIELIAVKARCEELKNKPDIEQISLHEKRHVFSDDVIEQTGPAHVADIDVLQHIETDEVSNTISSESETFGELTQAVEMSREVTVELEASLKLVAQERDDLAAKLTSLKLVGDELEQEKAVKCQLLQQISELETKLAAAVEEREELNVKLQTLDCQLEQAAVERTDLKLLLESLTKDHEQSLASMTEERNRLAEKLDLVSKECGDIDTIKKSVGVLLQAKIDPSWNMNC